MNEYLWPSTRIAEAIEQLARASGLARDLHAQPGTASGSMESIALRLGLEAQAVETPYPDLESQLPRMAPAIIQIGDSFLLLVRHSPPITLLAPNGLKYTARSGDIRAALCSELETGVAAEVDDILARSKIRRAKLAAARSAILQEMLRSKLVRGIWLLRLPPSASFWQQLRQAGVPVRLAALVSAHTAQYLLWILAWWILGANVLRGATDRSWIILWALLLFTLIPIRALITWLQGRIAIAAGARLKQRLFLGAMRLEPDQIRHQGAGQLLGRVIETEALEGLALSGGFLALVASIELAVSVFVLGVGAGGVLQAILLVAWVAVALSIAKRYYRSDQAWTDVRLAMTHDLVESMAGYRTRLVQLPPDRWHDGEDEVLERYLKASQTMDGSTTALLAWVPRGWLILGLLGLISAFARGADSPALLAVAVGGMLLAYRAFKRVAAGAWQLAGAYVAWQRVSVLYQAATRPEELGNPETPAAAESHKLVEAADLAFRYSARTAPVLHGCNLEIAAGDRLVLEGASGGGKSTLVSLLIGMRQPDAGRLLMDGFDRHALGAEAWRRYIAAAPQFHENHVLAETFAFNLFMGRRGLIGPAELDEAESICYELGLGGLLERMPSGLLQMVGETGWQLSHGERSRLYIARALLQNSELVVLDESFAALDPENLRRAMQCVLGRARSLLVISHR